jgi:hypothetical protein
MSKPERNYGSVPGCYLTLIAALSSCMVLGCNADGPRTASGVALAPPATTPVTPGVMTAASASSAAGSSAAPTLAMAAAGSGGAPSQAGAAAGAPSSGGVATVLPASDVCDVSSEACALSISCPAVQLCAAIPLVSEVELDASMWTGRCVPECDPSSNSNGCEWQQQSCPAGYRCIPCAQLQ